MPAEFERFGDSWRQLHPDWEMQLWTDANLPLLRNRKSFDQAPSLAAKADILRYEILLRHGGVYVDTDFECLQAIDPLLVGLDCFVAQQKDLEADFGKFCYVNNALIGAVPGHALLRDLVELLESHIEGLPADMPASFLTGPHFLTSVLQSHPSVKIFPAELFYPYTATERWRRFERFPRAFGVHHWTLSDTAVARTSPRVLRAATENCLTIAVATEGAAKPDKLRWTLEGLCARSVPNFEVLVAANPDDQAVADVVGDYRERLHIELLLSTSDESPASRRNRAGQRARAPRILFLDSDCLPDPDVVETHGRQGQRAALCFGYVRTYPADKYFPFRDAVDYTSLWQYCRSESQNLYIKPSMEQWRDVARCCFSVPVSLMSAIGGFRDLLSGDEGLDLAQRLAQAACPSVPCIYGARVTRMGGPPAGVRLGDGPQTAAPSLRLVLNTDIVSLRKRNSGGQGINGKSPYAIRIAGLSGPRSKAISSLTYHLLNEFKTPAVPAEAIARVAQQIATAPEQNARAHGLCAGYVIQFMSTGALVPTGDLNAVLLLNSSDAGAKQ